MSQEICLYLQNTCNSNVFSSFSYLGWQSCSVEGEKGRELPAHINKGVFVFFFWRGFRAPFQISSNGKCRAKWKWPSTILHILCGCWKWRGFCQIHLKGQAHKSFSSEKSLLRISACLLLNRTLSSIRFDAWRKPKRRELEGAGPSVLLTSTILK